MTGHATLDQLRAQHAWRVVEDVRTKKGDTGKKYAQEARRLAVRIRMAGLGQALGFLYAKSDSSDHDPKGLILKHLADWLLDQRELAACPPGAHNRNAVIRAIMDGNADLLRRLTEEALRYLQWLTRFTEAEFGSDDFDG